MIFVKSQAASFDGRRPPARTPRIILHHVLVVAVGGGEVHGGRGGPEPEEAEVRVIQLGGAETIPQGGQRHEGR
ncbi:hypothetical protein E2C01_001468 [Portunus trituberculatus]|uniref:Uncharacterized protein n=1 Tax=Portunus trituberculatus TaxID=210409 RepID=A0A5B7CMK4_PORTR|nr:hypothetical protein [Portunus trituberculatus]